MNFNERLVRRRTQDNLRSLSLPEKSLIDFASNDYLGLARSKILKENVLLEWDVWQETHPQNGFGSTGSRLLTGNSAYAETLEEAIAHFHGYEAGLLYNCGYMANLGLLSTLGEEDSLIFDLHLHASSQDGIRLSKARRYAFRHNDLDHLESVLKKADGKKSVCVQSVYSTDGSEAPLEGICHLCRRYDAYLIVDEAHAIGIYGKQGVGLVQEKKLTPYVFAQINTFGKALGTQGAIILGSALLKKYLVNFSRPFIYTTALPLCSLIAVKNAYDLFPSMESERQHLFRLISLFQDNVRENCFSPLQSIKVGGNSRTKKLAKDLMDLGFDVRALTSPTVPSRKECLRVCLHAFNTESEVFQLLEQLKKNLYE